MRVCVEFGIFFLIYFSPRKNNYHFYPILKVPDTKIGYDCFASRSQKRATNGELDNIYQ